MIVYNRDFLGVSGNPREHNSILVVDANRVVSRPSPLESFQSVRRWNSKVSQLMGGIEHIKLSSGNGPNSIGYSTGRFSIKPVEYIFGCLISKVNDHGTV